MGAELGTAGPGLTSTSPEEQRRSRISVRLKAIQTGHLARSEQEQVSGHDSIDSRLSVQTKIR